MTTYIDFKSLKESVRIEDVAQAFDIELKGSNGSLRGECPMCRGSSRELAVNTKEGSYFCHNAKYGGDLISLIAHTEGVRMKEAAQMIAERMGYQKEEERSDLKPLDYLQPEHEAVEALGIKPDILKATGGGYAPRGILRGTVAIAVRRQDGTLVGYIGIPAHTELKMPKNFMVQ